MKNRIKKEIIIGIVLIVAAYVFIVNPYAFFLNANVSNRKLADPAGMTYIEFFQNIADGYNIKIDKVVASKTRVIYLYSADISSLPDEKIFEFFAEFSSADGDLIITDKSGQEHNTSLMLVYSNGHEYDSLISNAYYGESFMGGSSWLKRDGKTIYSEYSSGTSPRKNITPSKGNPCNQCGGDGRTHDWNDEGTFCWKCHGDGYIGPND